MAADDSEHERQRLAHLSAGMTDGELQKVADDARSLMPVARQVLEEEIGRRGASVTLSDSAPGWDQVEKREVVAIRRFRDLPEALLAKGSLHSAGIECFLADDNMVRMDWFISNLLGGIKLVVNLEDAEEAMALLDQPIPEGFEVEGVGEYEQPRCPQCQSLDVSFEELNKKVAYTSAWLGVPIPLQYESWRCHSCGHSWKDTDADVRIDPQP